MDEFLRWIGLLSKSKSYRQAKVWACLSCALAVLFAWTVGHGELVWGFVLALLSGFCGWNFLEKLAEARHAVAVVSRLNPDQFVTYHQQHEHEDEDEDGSEQGQGQELEIIEYGPVPGSPGMSNYSYNNSSSSSSYGTTSNAQAESEASQGQGQGPGQGDTPTTTWEASEHAQYRVEVESDESKLALCQHYVFLYLTLSLGKTGEATLSKLTVGKLGARRYREWMRDLALDWTPDPAHDRNSDETRPHGEPEERLAIMEIRPGASPVALVTFEEALEIIANYNDQADQWSFAEGVYADRRNWTKIAPDSIIIEGRKVALNANRQNGSGSGKDSPIVPLYPDKLSDLNI